VSQGAHSEGSEIREELHFRKFGRIISVRCSSSYLTGADFDIGLMERDEVEDESINPTSY